VLPFPALLLGAVVELDLGHAGDQLDQVGLVLRHLVEALVIQLGAFFQEDEDPDEGQQRADEEDQEDRFAVKPQDGAEDDQVHQ